MKRMLSLMYTQQRSWDKYLTHDPKIAFEKSQTWAKTLKPHQFDLIQRWTGIGHRSMLSEERQALLSVIQSAPQYNGRAYRVVVEGSGEEGTLRSATMGDCFDLKLFYHYEKKNLRPRVIEIDLTQAPGKAIAGASRVPTEREVLIEPDVELQSVASKKRWGRHINCFIAFKA